MNEMPDMPDLACPCTGWVCESLDAAGQSTRCGDVAEVAES